MTAETRKMRRSPSDIADQDRAADHPGRPGLLAEPRRMRILAWLQEEGSARVKDLSQAFNVSEVTIRQDLERLDADGHVTRQHGGAFLRSLPRQVEALALQHLVNMDLKRRIGRAAARLVTDGETIILDAGSTTTEVAANLANRQGLNVITNGLNIALMLGSNPSCAVHMPGGQFKAPTLSLSGEKSPDFFSNIHASKLFLAVGGFSLAAGLTYPSLADLPLKAAMVRAASEVFLVADSTKMDRASFSSLGKLDLVDTLITDAGIGDDRRKMLETAGLNVIVAD